MSELTQCNFCSWQSILRRAEELGRKTRLADSTEIQGWTSAQVEQPDGSWKEAALFMELTNHCVC